MSDQPRLRNTTLMEISDVESKFKFTFPERHRQALLDFSDPIHEACAFLDLSDIVRENDWIHGPKCGDPWPDFLIAFASNQCGDFFAYDTRQNPASIIYIDPDNTVGENLESSDKLSYATFEHWYESYVA